MGIIEQVCLKSKDQTMLLRQIIERQIRYRRGSGSSGTTSFHINIFAGKRVSFCSAFFYIKTRDSEYLVIRPGRPRLAAMADSEESKLNGRVSLP